MTAMTRLAERVRRVPPAGIVLAAWLGVVLYGLPGYLPGEAIRRLAAAREGRYGDLSALAWRVVDFIVPGPFGMLVLQTGGFALGAYLVLRRFMAARPAAWSTLAILWWPPIAGTLAVVWPESLATALLALGAGAVLSDRPRRRLAGLVVLALAGSILAHGALVAGAVALSYAWRGRRIVPALLAAGLVAVVALGVALGHPPRDRTSLRDAAAPGGSQAYVGFVGDDDASVSAGTIHHDARASRLQDVLQPAMRWLGATWLFDPRAYALLAALLAAAAFRDRVARVLLGSGLVAYAAAWVDGSSSELRFALWTCAATALATAILVATRAGRGQAPARSNGASPS